MNVRVAPFQHDLTTNSAVFVIFKDCRTIGMVHCRLSASPFRLMKTDGFFIILEGEERAA